MNNKLDQKKFDDIYFEGKPMYNKVNGGTFNVVYLREYIDPECESETFAAYETIYRNVPNKYLEKFNNEKMKMKMLAGVSNLIYNPTLGTVMQRNLDLLGPPVFTDQERQYAKKMQSTMTSEDIETAYIQAGISLIRDQVLAESIVPADAKPIGIIGTCAVLEILIIPSETF